MKGNYLSLALLAIMTLIIVSCETKGEPTTLGEILSEEQLASIPADDSWNGKMIAIKGYANFDRMLLKFGTKNIFNIANTPNGNPIIQASIGLRDANKSEGVTIAGEKSRNYIQVPSDNLTISAATFITDNYEEKEFGEFIFNGKLVCENGKYVLENVSIHTP